MFCIIIVSILLISTIFGSIDYDSPKYWQRKYDIEKYWH